MHHGELFGKDDGYCRGRGGSMHIADFTVGHLAPMPLLGRGANCHRCGPGEPLSGSGQRGLCFAGDGAYANGVVLESLNFAAQAQFTNHLSRAGKAGCRSSSWCATTIMA